jgi:hypothetical protein
MGNQTSPRRSPRRANLPASSSTSARTASVGSVSSSVSSLPILVAGTRPVHSSVGAWQCLQAYRSLCRWFDCPMRAGQGSMSSTQARAHEKLEAKKSAVFSVLAKATHKDELDLAGACRSSCPLRPPSHVFLMISLPFRLLAYSPILMLCCSFLVPCS